MPQIYLFFKSLAFDYFFIKKQQTNKLSIMSICVQVCVVHVYIYKKNSINNIISFKCVLKNRKNTIYNYNKIFHYTLQDNNVNFVK